MKILFFSFLLLLSGCNQLFKDINKDIDKDSSITYYFASGIKLKVSENNIATVFGYDDCPIIDFLFGSKLSNGNCIKLVDNQLSNVRLINQDGSVTISKFLSQYNGNKIYITHNGYQVMQIK